MKLVFNFVENLLPKNYIRLISPDGIVYCGKRIVVPLEDGIYQLSFLYAGKIETNKTYIEYVNNEFNLSYSSGSVKANGKRSSVFNSLLYILNTSNEEITEEECEASQVILQVSENPLS